MRLHPAVAAALVLVGGVLLALRVYEWLRLASVRSAGADLPSSLIPVSLFSGTLGLLFVLVAVVFSFESRPGQGDSA